MDEITTLVAKYAIGIPVIIALIVFVRLKEKRARIEFAILIAVGGALSLALAKLGSQLINDPRPFVVGHFTPLVPHASDNGFPSDHTLLASFLGYAIVPFSRKIGILTLAVAACIGLSRVAVGVHHLEDILGSFIITGGACLLVLIGIEIIRLRQKPDAQ